MKKIFLKHLSGGILILFFALLCSMPVFAKTVSGNDPELVTGGGDAGSVRYNNLGS